MKEEEGQGNPDWKLCKVNNHPPSRRTRLPCLALIAFDRHCASPFWFSSLTYCSLHYFVKMGPESIGRHGLAVTMDKEGGAAVVKA
jgi:hypothetical protein